MASWKDVTAECPELADDVRRRFELHGLALIATVRRDGSPRISGIEFIFDAGWLWLGMMPNSLKARDVLRDPRIALHNATVDKNVAEGDAKIAGRVIEVADEKTFAEFRAAFEARNGYPPPPGDFPLFQVDVNEISMLRPAGDHLDIRWWREGEGLKQVDRY